MRKRPIDIEMLIFQAQALGHTQEKMCSSNKIVLWFAKKHLVNRLNIGLAFMNRRLVDRR